MIRLARPTIGDRAAFISDVQAILVSGVFTRGEHVLALEQAVADAVGTEYAVAVSSGTAALHLTMLALDLSSADEVIVPAFTFPATANVVELVGARTRFVDVDERTYATTPANLDTAVSPRTRAMIAVHPFGNPADISGLRERIASNVMLIEDAAAALGAAMVDSFTGSQGDVGCFSFHPRKIVTTGEGGAITTNNGEFAELCRSLRNHGMPSSHGEGMSGFRPGLNYRLPEISAALGMAQLRRLPATIRRRNELHEELKSKLEEIPDVHAQVSTSGMRPAWSSFICRMEGHSARRLITILTSLGVEATVSTYAIHELPYFSERYGLGPDDFPVASALHRETVALPFYDGLTELEIDTVVRAVQRAVLP